MPDATPEVIYEGKHVRLVRRGEWEYVTRKNVTGIVGIVAVTDEGKLLLVEQPRPPLNRNVIELPAGLAGDVAGQEGEELANAARRELLEETGYAGEISIVAHTWLSGASRTQRFCAVARGAESVSAPRNEPGEFCDVVLVSLAQFREHLRSGQLTDVDLGYLGLDHAGLVH